MRRADDAAAGRRIETARVPAEAGVICEAATLTPRRLADR